MSRSIHCLGFAVLVAFANFAPAQPAKTKPRLDLLGDPLPPGAVARLGHLRFHHEGQIQCLALSPDGKMLASAVSEWVPDKATRSAIYLWEAATGKRLKRIPVDERSFARRLSFSPDGKLLAVLHDGLTVWDVNKAARLFQKKEHCDHFQFSRKNEKLFFLTDDCVFTLNARSGLILSQTKVDGVCLAVHPDERRFVWFKTGELMVQPLENGAKADSFAKVPDQPLSLYFHPNGKNFVVDCRSKGIIAPGELLALEFPSGKVRWRKRTGHDLRSSLTLSPNGEFVLCETKEDETLLHFESGEECEEIKSLGRAAAFSANGNLIASASFSRVTIWDARTKKKQSFGPLPGDVARVFFHDNATIQTLDPRGGSSLWNARMGQRQSWTAMPLDLVWFRPPQLCPEARLLLFWHNTGYWIGEAKSGRGLREISKVNESVMAAWFSKDGKKVNVVYFKKKKNLRAFDARSGRHLTARHIPGLDVSEDEISGAPAKFVVSPDREQAAVISGDAISLVDLVTLKHTGSFRNPLPKRDDVIAPTDPYLHFSPDNRYLLASQRDRAGKGYFEMCEPASGNRVHFWTIHDFSPNDSPLLLTPDSRIILANGNHIEIWQIPDTKPSAVLKGHQGLLADLALSPDGKTLASSSNDSTVLLWDLDAMSKANPRRPRPISATEFQRCWDALAFKEAPSAEFLTLLDDPAQTLAAIRDQVQPSPHASPKEIQAWIADLASPKFATRQQAKEKLLALQDASHDALNRALAQPDLSLETERRLEKLRAQTAGRYTTPTQRRRWYALDLLDRIAAPQARAELERLSKGNPDTDFTKEAKKRLAR